MGAGRRTETYLGPHFPGAGASPSSSTNIQFLNLPVGELASVIFGCTHATYEECVNQLIFGLPQQHYCYIKNIQPGMPLFLFNYSDRKLHGIFEAESRGDLNINPYAWTGGKAGKTQFPAQVRVIVKHKCPPLSEKAFKEALVANYYKDPNHFYFELNHVQTEMLQSLFRRNTTYKSSQTGPPAWAQAGHEEGWNTPKKSVKTMMDGRHNSSAFIPSPPLTSPARSDGRIIAPENWDDGSDKVEDGTTAGNGGFDSLDAANRSLERAAKKSLDRRASVKLSNGKPSEVEEDRRKAEWKLEVLEKLRQMKEEGKMQSNVETRAELPGVQGELQGEASSSSFVESKLSNGKTIEVEEDRREAEWKLEVLEKLRQMKEEGKMQSNVEMRTELLRARGGSQGEASSSSFVESTKVQDVAFVETTNGQDSARVEWEKLARERCLQEQTMLREERELLREKCIALDVPVAKTINKNLEICASAIAQMRQDQIKLRHIMDEAMNQAELLRELDQLRKKNAILENTQVQMASELERLKSDVARMSQQLRLLPSQTNPMPHQSEAHMQNAVQVPEAGSSGQNGHQDYYQQVYLIGGYDGGSWLGSVDIFYPATYEIASIAPLLTARSYAAAAVLMGSIYILGGGNGKLWYDTVEIYNEDRDEWTWCPSMSLKRGSLAAATVGDRIFAVGGGNKDFYFSEVECYDAQLGMWISSTSMLSKRFGVAAAELDGALYAMGGYDEQAYLASVERFDPREALWTAVAPMTTRRGSFSAVALGGKLYAIGGYDGTQFLNSMEFYEPRMNCWTEMELRMHTARAFAAVARVGSDICIFGGLNKDCYIDTVEYYTEASGWEFVDDLDLGARCFLACATLE